MSLSPWEIPEISQKNKFVGYQAIFDIKNCKIDITDIEYIKYFIDVMIKSAKMKPYGKPLVKHVIIPDKPYLNGVSVVQLIYTSSVTCHFMDDTGDAYIDFFSCKKFDVDVLINVINHLLKPQSIKIRLLIRK